MTMQQTSLDAYHTIRPVIGKKQKMVFDQLQCGPATAQELSAFLRVPINEITPRVCELRKMGWVMAIDTRKNPRSGKDCNVWGVVHG